MSTVGLHCTVLYCALPPIGVSPPGWVNVPGDGVPGFVVTTDGIPGLGSCLRLGYFVRFILCVSTNRGIPTWLGQCFPVMGGTRICSYH